jgi:hypothetical protein
MSNTAYEDDVDLVGQIREADRDNGGFEFTTDDGRRIPVNPTPGFFDVAVRHFAGNDHVRLRGTGLFDASGALQRVTNTLDLSGVETNEAVTGCPTSVHEQINSLVALEDGWYDETTTKYDQAQLGWLESLIGTVVSVFSIPTPYIYPSPEGFIRAEWSAPNTEVIATIDVVIRGARVVAVRDDNEVTEESLDFRRAGDESRFVKFLAENLKPQKA